jgi:hypothetical protein
MDVCLFVCLMLVCLSLVCCQVEVSATD